MWDGWPTFQDAVQSASDALEHKLAELDSLASELVLDEELSELGLEPELPPLPPLAPLARATLSVVKAGAVYAPSANAPSRPSALRRERFLSVVSVIECLLLRGAFECLAR